MKKSLCKAISIFLVFLTVFTLFENGILQLTKTFAATDNAAISSTSKAPEGYVAENTTIEKPALFRRKKPTETPKVLLIEDVNPWSSTANQTVLSDVTEFDKVTTQQFLTVDLSQYGVIVFANDQPFSTYENYVEFKEYMELFASIGGVIVFGACDAGWAGGNLAEKLPGNVTKTNHYENRNYIVDNDHPIVSGILTENTALTDKDLFSNYCSHVSFNESSFPAGTNVILRESSSKKPTLIEYPLGKGRVIATGLTWEHNYVYGGQSFDLGIRGSFAKIAMEDMFRYAIKISSIDVEELHLLEEWRIKKNAHAIIVADSSTAGDDLAPIANAKVVIGSEEFITDENGTVYYTENFGMKNVTVSADGFREQKLKYKLEERQSHIFFLEKEKNDGLPYVVQVTAEGSPNIDLRDQVINFTEGDGKSLSVLLAANWNGHGEGEYIFYQEPTVSDKGKSFNAAGGINLSFGKIFKANREVKLKLVAEDGTESEPIKLNIVINPAPKSTPTLNNSSLKEGVSKFDWFGTIPVKSDNDVITKVFPKDFEFSSDLIPIEISREQNDDGTITYKGVVGLASGDKVKNILNSKSDEHKFKEKDPWKEFKDQIEDFKNADDAKSYFEDLKKGFGKAYKATRLRITSEYTIDVCGFLEVNVGLDGKIKHSDAGLIISGGATYKEGRTIFVNGTFPIYYECSLGVNFDAKAGISFIPADDGIIFMPQYDGLSFDLPKASLEGGIGVRNLATLGVNATGKLNVKFNPIEPSDPIVNALQSTGSLSMSGYIKAKVLFVLNWNYEFAKGSTTLWPKGKSMKARLMGEAPENNLTFVSRDYLDNKTKWNGQIINKRARIITNDFKTLQEGVMSDAMPKIYQVRDKLVMLYLDDNASRSLGNNTQLMYSIYQYGVWSEPQPVWESDTADYFFDAIVTNNELHIVWQKSSSTIEMSDAEVMLEKIAENSEICYAKFNEESSKFDKQQYITNDSKLDLLPTITENDNGVTVVWATSDDNDIINSTGTYTFNTIDINSASIGEIVTLGNTEESVSEIEAVYTDSGLHILYSTLNDNSSCNLYHLNKDTVTVLENSGVAGLSHNKQNVLWQSAGSIYSYNVDSKMVNTLIDQGNISSSYKYISNNNNEAVIWFDSSDQFVVKASYLRDGVWCPAITLYEKEIGGVTFIDTQMLSDDKIACVINTAYFYNGEATNTALKFNIIEPNNDVELVAVYSDADYETKKQNVDFYVKNNGFSTVTELDVSLASNDTSFIDEKISVNIKPGEEYNFTEVMDIATLNSVTEITASIYNDLDSDLTNNEKKFTIGQTDIGLNVETYNKENNVIFVFNTFNRSATPADVALSIIEDNLDGIVIDVKNIGTITNEESVQYIYSIDKTKIDFGDNNSKTYCFTVSSIEEDLMDTDNTYFYTFFNEQEEEIDEDGTYDVITLVDPVSVEINERDIVFENVNSEGKQLNANILPSNATLTSTNWVVENADIVHIDSTGFITPLREGTTTITVSVTDTITDTITVTVLGEEVDLPEDKPSEEPDNNEETENKSFFDQLFELIEKIIELVFKIVSLAKN